MESRTNRISQTSKRISDIRDKMTIVTNRKRREKKNILSLSVADPVSSIPGAPYDPLSWPVARSDPWV